MKGVDTNVLVRYLTQDDASQGKRATAVFERALTAGERIHVDTVVLCELVWVLRTAYGHGTRGTALRVATRRSPSTACTGRATSSLCSNLSLAEVPLG